MGKLPTHETLLETGKVLASKYSSANAYRAALRSPAASKIPLGTAWSAGIVDPINRQDDSSDETSDTDLSEESEGVGERSARKSRKKQPGAADFAKARFKLRPPAEGDHSLANSCLLLRDGLLAREASESVKGADLGRLYAVWQVSKGVLAKGAAEVIQFPQAWIFSFAGSGHHNYSQYLIRTYIMFKYEFSEALRNTVLQNMLVNPSGSYDGMHQADLMQEHHNRTLEDFVQHKGAEFASPHIRDGVAPNVHHLQQIKDSMEQGVGLSRRTTRHSDQVHDTELQKLLDIYWEEELHRHRPGRTYGHLADDQIDEGFQKLEHGQLRKYIDAELVSEDPILSSDVNGIEELEEDPVAEGPEADSGRGGEEGNDRGDGIIAWTQLAGETDDGFPTAQDSEEDLSVSEESEDVESDADETEESEWDN